jgi:Xaa-Pro aminopeptidase
MAPNATRSTPAAKALPYAGRLKRLAGLLRGADVPNLLVTSPIDVGYLTGFLGGESYLLVSASGGRPVVISDFRYEEELEPVKALADLHIRSATAQGETMPRAIAAVFSARRVERCGFQADHLTVAGRDELAALIGAKKFVPTSGLIAQMRIVKDEHEVRLMKAATRLQEEALQAILPTIEPGQTELEIAARLEAEMKSRGSSQPGFPSIIAAGATGSLPHYRPGRRKTVAGKTLLIDWGATFQGYQSDMTRTFALGSWPRKMKEIYDITLRAQMTAAAALAPGKTNHQIDRVARDIITRAGYGDQFGHGLGHGLGMVKDPPYLNPLYAEMTLVPGHVVTVEPGIYLPGIGGVRIEDLYVITDRGAKNLCSLPKTIEWATLGG